VSLLLLLLLLKYCFVDSVENICTIIHLCSFFCIESCRILSTRFVLTHLQSTTVQQILVCRRLTLISIILCLTIRLLAVLTVEYKIAILMLMAKCGAADYLCSFLTGYQPTKTLPSMDTELLCWPRTSSDFESHCFTKAAPTIWNSLSVNTRTANSIGTFRSRLKTDLFAKAYVT